MLVTSDGCTWKQGNVCVRDKMDARGCLLILSGHLLAVRNGENQEGEKMERVMSRELVDKMTWVPLRAMWPC